MKIAIGNDHAGVYYKNLIIKYLQEQGHEVINFGTDTTDSVDYPDFGQKVGIAVRDKQCDKGIVICGTGIGISISANKIDGVRCSLCHDIFTAELTRLHNDANVLALGARVLGEDLMLAIVKTWLDTPFSQDARHQRRINKIHDGEKL